MTRKLLKPVPVKTVRPAAKGASKPKMPKVEITQAEIDAHAEMLRARFKATGRESYIRFYPQSAEIREYVRHSAMNAKSFAVGQRVLGKGKRG